MIAIPFDVRGVSRRILNLAVLKSAALYIGLAFLCLLLGIFIVFLPPLFIGVLVGAALYLLLLLVRPWLGLAVYLAIVLLSPDWKLADVVTAFTLGVFAARLYFTGKFSGFPIRRFAPYVLFIALMIISVGVGKYVFGNEVPFIYRDGRVILYWLWFPLVYALAASDVNGGVRIWRLVAFIAILISGLALLQYLTGIQLVAEGRVGALETMGDYDSSSTRVQMPGFYFVSLFLVVSVLYANSTAKKLAIVLPLVVFLAVAIYVNFGRALWVWTALAIFFSTFFLGWRRGGRMFATLMVVAVLVFGALSMFKPATVNLLATRITSIFSEGGARTSYGWRKLENEDAMRAIIRSPLVGVGMGGEYRSWMGEVGSFKEHTRYLHHSYLYVALKAGVPALLALLAFLVLAWRCGWRNFRAKQRNGEVDFRLVATLTGMPAVMALCVTQPELMSAFGAVFFSLTAAFLFANKPSASTAN